MATPAVTAAVANFLAAQGATLTDLVAGKTLEDVYFETVGSGRRDRGRTRQPASGTGDGAGGVGRPEPEAGPVSTTAAAPCGRSPPRPAPRST